MGSIPEITYYVPCLNEEKLIAKTLDKIVKVSRQLGIDFEVLIFDDGSSDSSRLVVLEYKKLNPDLDIKLICCNSRRGLGFNYVDGAFRGSGKLYTMICGDNSETEESMIKMLSYRNKAEMVIPYFTNLDNRNIVRRRLSRMFVFLVNLFSGYSLRYYNGPTIHLRENIKRWHPTGSGFAFQAEMLCIMLDMKISYIEVQIDNNDREEGFSRAFHIKNILSVGHSLTQILFRRIRNYFWPTQDLNNVKVFN